MAEVIDAGEAGLFKTCKFCNEAKSLASFYAHHEGLMGKRPECIECFMGRQRAKKALLGLPMIGNVPCAMCGVIISQNSAVHKFCETCSIVANKTRDAERSRRRSKTVSYRSFRLSYDRERRKSDPVFMLNRRMSQAIRVSLISGKNGKRWEAIVGYDVATLRAHIERQFLPGMSWENMGEWHVDHIVPKHSYAYDNENDPDFKACWSLSNLRPLWAEDNLKKGGTRLHLL